MCLANSRKINGRCIAGRELVDGVPAAWIRTVSSREHQEVSEYERQYADGSDPRVLDVMDVPLLHSNPVTYQQENWLLDPGSYWTRVGHIDRGGLDAFTGTAGPLWVNGHSTFKGLNDQVPVAVATTLESSLTLIRVSSLVLSVFAPSEAFGNAKRRVQARFTHAGDGYRLWVTDPIYERRYLGRPDGQYQIPDSFLTISLGEPYQGNCYKLVAAIIEQEQTQDE